MIEVSTIIDVMNETDDKKKIGLSIPETVIGAFDRLCDEKVNGKEKWIVLVAALASFMERSVEEQNDYIAKVMNANAPGRGFSAIIPKKYTQMHGVTITTKGARRDSI